MKKVFQTMIFLLFFGTVLHAQVIFSEDFDGIPGNTSGGAGTYTFAPGWSLFNIDALTPSPSVSYVNEAWERREDFKFSVTDSAAFSTSWYSPSGQADDWMFTPAIVLTDNCKLKWNAVAYDPEYLDGYEVRIMTEVPNSGNIGSSEILFSIPSENSAWTAREVSLNDYAGQTVYIGFRNHSADMFLLLIDDVVVERILPYDAAVTLLDTISEYTMIPQSVGLNIPLKATVKNSGINALTNVKLGVFIKNSSELPYYFAHSESIPTLAPDAESSFTFNDYEPFQSDDYIIQFFPVMDETDVFADNDTLTTTININDSVFARDNGEITGSLGIGAGNGGYIGQKFHLNNGAYLTSVSYHINTGYLDEKMAIAIFNMSAGVPASTTPFASTDTLICTSETDSTYSFKIHGGNLFLEPGDYLFAGIEFDSTLTLANCSGKFTPNTVFVWWPTTPLGGWAPVEAFGESFAKTFVIRPVFGDPCADFSFEINTFDATCESCADGSAEAVVTGANGSVSYDWGAAGSTPSVNNLFPGNYPVTVIDEAGCTLNGNAEISYTTSVANSKNANFSVFPNPSNGTFNVQLSSAYKGQARIEIINILGKIVYSNLFTDNDLVKNIELRDVTPGVYMITIQSGATKITKRIQIKK